MKITPEIIKSARLKAGLTQTQAAEKMGLKNYQQFQQWERGDNGMSIAAEKLFKILFKEYL